MNLRKHWFLPALLMWAAIFGIYEVVERTLLRDASLATLHVLHILRGTITSFLLAAFVAGFMIRSGVPKEQQDGTEGLVARAGWLIRLRWVAIAGVAAAILVARVGLRLLTPPAVAALSVIAGIMVLYNLAFMAIVRRVHAPRAIALAQIFLDLIALTLLLYFSGGIGNPFFGFFVFHVIIAGILLRRHESYLIAGIASVLLCGMVLLSRSGIIEGHPLGVLPQLPDDYVSGILVAFVVTVFFSTYFTTTIMADLRRVAGELGREKSKLDDIIQGMGAGLIVLDRELRVEWMNDQAARWFGAAEAGTPCHRVMCKAPEPCTPCTAGDTLRAGRPSSREHSLGGRHFLTTTTAVRGPDGEIGNILILVKETTAQKRMEKDLRQAGKMAAVGQLASGIAHELNNPLATIAASADFLEEIAEDQDLGDPFPRYLTRIEDHVQRCKDIIECLLGFAREEETEIVPTDVNRAVREALELTGRRISPVLELSGPAPMALADPRLIQQVLLNLLRNACDAAGEDGKVSLSTASADGEVRITVKDDGTGIPPEDLPRVFEPFFTTKPAGRGTGLGLYLCHRMVEALGGRIEVESEHGRGTSFTVSLRRAEAS